LLSMSVFRRGPLKRIILAVAISILLTPHFAKAWDGENDDGDHPRISAKEMTTIGVAAASLIGIVGYLALRRRKQA